VINYFDDDVANNVPNTLRVLAILYAILCIPSSFFIKMKEKEDN
jgi:hypothetical protein